MTGEHIDWKPGSKMHAHVGTCIKCGSHDGDTVIYVAVIRTPGGRLGIGLEGVGSTLCPRCKSNYLPITPAMDRELSRLGDRLWRDLKRRGCPHCQCGLDWSPGGHRPMVKPL